MDTLLSSWLHWNIHIDVLKFHCFLSITYLVFFVSRKISGWGQDKHFKLVLDYNQELLDYNQELLDFKQELLLEHDRKFTSQ